MIEFKVILHAKNDCVLTTLADNALDLRHSLSVLGVPYDIYCLELGAEPIYQYNGEQYNDEVIR